MTIEESDEKTIDELILTLKQLCRSIVDVAIRDERYFEARELLTLLENFMTFRNKNLKKEKLDVSTSYDEPKDMPDYSNF